MKDAFYNAKLALLTKKYLKKGLDIYSALESAEKELDS